MSFTLSHQMDNIFQNGLRIIQSNEVSIKNEWDRILSHLQKTRNQTAIEYVKATIHFFIGYLFNKNHSQMEEISNTVATESFYTNQFVLTLLENAVHKVIQASDTCTYHDHQTIQYLFTKISEDLLSHPYHKYFAIDTFVRNLVSANQLPILWIAILHKRKNYYVVEKWFNNLSHDLLLSNEEVSANSIFSLSEILLNQMPQEDRRKVSVLPIPYEDITLLVCAEKEESGQIVPFLSYALQIFQNGRDSYKFSKQEHQWKDSVIMFNETVMRSKNFEEAVENITSGFVNYLPFERCALFSYSIENQMGFGVFGHRLDNSAIQNITEEISNLPIIQNNLQLLQLFGKSLDYLQPIYVPDAKLGFPMQYIEQFNLRSVVIAPIYLSSSSKLLGAAILDQGPGKSFKVGKETFKALLKFGQTAGEILAKYHFSQEESSKTDHFNLSPREIEVLKLMADGASTSEAASKLFLSEYTVRDYISTIMQKMEAKNRTEAVAKGIRNGII